MGAHALAQVSATYNGSDCAPQADAFFFAWIVASLSREPRGRVGDQASWDVQSFRGFEQGISAMKGRPASAGPRSPQRGNRGSWELRLSRDLHGRPCRAVHTPT